LTFKTLGVFLTKQTNKRGPTNWSVRGNSYQDIKKVSNIFRILCRLKNYQYPNWKKNANFF
jgi:hypothetical protein